MISYTRQLDELCKVGVPQHLTAHSLAADTALVYRDLFGSRIYIDDSGREAVTEARRKVWWYWI